MAPALAHPARGLGLRTHHHCRRICAPRLHASRFSASRLRAVTCFASFIPDSVDDILTTGTVVVSGLAILGTAALAARSPKRPPSPDDEGFQYGIMSVVSCIPLFSWTAWVLPALERPDRAALYYTYALLYSYPLIKDGFDIEGYTWLMLLLGIVHVQVERIANTEPQTFQGANPLAAALGLVGLLAEQVVGFASSLVGVVASDTKQAIRGGTREDDPGRILGGDESALSSSEDVESLKEFDRRMMARETDKRRRQQNKGGR